MDKVNTPSIKVSLPTSTAVQSSHEAQATLSASPSLETIKHEHEVFKRDANIVLSDVSKGFQRFIAEEAKHEAPKLFGSNRSGKAFHAVSSRLESFLAWQKGAVGRRFNMEKTPYYQSLKNVAKGMGSISESVDELHETLEQVISSKDTTSTMKLKRKLRGVRDSVDMLLESVDYTAARNDREREKLLFSVCVFGESLLEGVEDAEVELEHSPDAVSAAHGLRELANPEVYQKALDKMNSPERLDFKAWAMEELAGIKKEATQLKADVTAQAAENKDIDSAESIKQEETIEVLQERCDEVAEKLDNVSLKSLETQGCTDNKITVGIEEIDLLVTHTASKLNKLSSEKTTPAKAEALSNKERATPEVVRQAEEKKTNVYAPTSSITSRHRCNIPSPHRPYEVNPSFYHEKQEQGLCLKHALNAFVGFEAFNLDDLVEGRIQEQNEYVGRSDYEKSPDLWLKSHPGHTLQDIQTRGDEIFYEVSKEHLQAIAGGIPLKDHVKEGNSAKVGEIILNRYQKRLGAPDLSFKGMLTMEETPKAVEKAKVESDRILVGYRTHFITYRQNKAGDWFKIDSTSIKQIREDPSAITARIDATSEVLHYKTKEPNIKTW